MLVNAFMGVFYAFIVAFYVLAWACIIGLGIHFAGLI